MIKYIKIKDDITEVSLIVKASKIEMIEEHKSGHAIRFYAKMGKYKVTPWITRTSAVDFVDALENAESGLNILDVSNNQLKYGAEPQNEL